jgi:putative spermidine/putrescine transport system substrate-binding protein
MKNLSFLCSTAVAVGMFLLPNAVSAGEITVMSWGGAYTKSQVEAYHKPWMAKTGHKLKSVDSPNPSAPIKAQVTAGKVSIDVADVEYSDAVRYCDEGLLEPIDPKVLPTGSNGAAAMDDFVKGGLTDCGVANIVWSTIFAYDSSKITGAKPTTMADFFDTKKFPGKRGLRKGAKANLEMALMADGVPASKVYDILGTPAGVKRAFAKMDSIKKDIVWWEAGAQAPQLLADGEVAMTTAYNGRIFNAAISENKPFMIVWDGQVLDFDMFVIPKGAPNKALAFDFIKFATGTKPLADQAKYIAYGPARKSSAAFVGLYQDGKTKMASHMPTAPANLKNALVNNFEFWADRSSELNERFNAWIAAN